MTKKKNNPGDFVPRRFCDERTRRIEQQIKSTKKEILAAINKKHNSPMTWQAKATILGSLIGSVSAIIIAFLA
ncbi:hypothetical protein ES702_01409 [subsurface metagenome]